MKRDHRSLAKAAKELFVHLAHTKNYDFSGPSYEGVSDKVFKDLTQDHLDSLQSAVLILKERIRVDQIMGQDDFVALAKDEYENLLPEIHEKKNKPGKKHDARFHHEDSDFSDDRRPKKSWR